MKPLRYYDCHFYHEDKNNPDEIIKNSNTACWAGIRPLKKDTVLYIDRYSEHFEQHYIDKLVFLLNKITPTSINKNYFGNGIPALQIKLPSNKYVKNLYILNFIRLLWYNAKGFNNELFFKGINGKIKNKCRYRDPLKILSFWMIYAMDKTHNHFGDHTNMYWGEYDEMKSKVRSLKEFNDWDGLSAMSYFSKNI